MADAQGNYERYLERYAKHNGISKEQAKEHFVVKEVKKAYFEEENGGKRNGK